MNMMSGRSISEIESIPKPQVYQPFELHKELAYQIKLALDSRGRRDPQIRIDLPFDKLIYDGGLKQLGKHSHNNRGSEVYTIRHYSDLNPLLGSNWHIRGVNARLNFCYLHLDTVQYYLYERQPLSSLDRKARRFWDPGIHLFLSLFEWMASRKIGNLFSNNEQINLSH